MRSYEWMPRSKKVFVLSVVSILVRVLVVVVGTRLSLATDDELIIKPHPPHWLQFNKPKQ